MAAFEVSGNIQINLNSLVTSFNIFPSSRAKEVNSIGLLGVACVSRESKNPGVDKKTITALLASVIYSLPNPFSKPISSFSPFLTLHLTLKDPSWAPPRRGFVKVNIRASTNTEALQNGNTNTIGILARNHRGKYL